MDFPQFSPIDFLAGAKLALDTAGLTPWVTISIIVIIAVTLISKTVE